jgi:hypothetical protein
MEQVSFGLAAMELHNYHRQTQPVSGIINDLNRLLLMYELGAHSQTGSESGKVWFVAVGLKRLFLKRIRDINLLVDLFNRLV